MIGGQHLFIFIYLTGTGMIANLFLEAFDPLAMRHLSGLQEQLCLELTVPQALCLYIQFPVMMGCHLQEVLCMSTLQLWDLDLCGSLFSFTGLKMENEKKKVDQGTGKLLFTLVIRKLRVTFRWTKLDPLQNKKCSRRGGVLLIFNNN